MAQINHNRINDSELAAINKTIEVLDAYKAGKIIEYNITFNVWVKCDLPPFISYDTAYKYRIVEDDKI